MKLQYSSRREEIFVRHVSMLQKRRSTCLNESPSIGMSYLKGKATINLPDLIEIQIVGKCFHIYFM